MKGKQSPSASKPNHSKSVSYGAPFKVQKLHKERQWQADNRITESENTIEHNLAKESDGYGGSIGVNDITILIVSKQYMPQ